MKEILRKLVRGVNRDDIPRSDLPLINELFASSLIEGNKVLTLKHGLKVGTLDVSSTGYGFFEELNMQASSRELKTKRDIRLSPQDLGGATKGDIVIVKLSPQGRGRFGQQKRSSRVVFVAQKGTDFIVVYLEKVKDLIKAFNVKTGQEIGIDVRQKALMQLPKRAVLKLDSLSGEVVEVLGVLDDPQVDEKISLALFGKHEDFPKKAFLEAQSFGTQVDKTLYPNRVDLTHLPFCTIDPVTAKDFDDAIYYDVSTATLYVAIADVSAYVFPYGAIDTEAKERGFSIYLPHKSIPMLPRNLSENICSLQPDVDRLTFTFKMKFDPVTFRLENMELFESIIHSVRRFDYDEVDQFLWKKSTGDTPLDRDILTWLLPLFEATRVLRTTRMSHGYEFHSSEVEIALDDQGGIASTHLAVQTESHSLIEECMLCANRCAATYFDYGIYRVHPAPKPEKLRHLVDDLLSIGVDIPKTKDTHTLIRSAQERVENSELKPYVDKLIIRSMQQASYSATNIGHFGLGFDDYTHFTSPIRRYSDLILHRYLKAILAHDEKSRKYMVQWMDDVCEQVSDLERESAKVQWDFADRKFARWANTMIGKSVNCVITDIDENGGRDSIAVVDDMVYGARIFFSPKNESLFEKVNLTIISVDLATTKIYGKIVHVQK